jgi:hypothetical protein
MNDYDRVKWIESENGIFALEVLEHPRGHAQFRVYQRHKMTDLPSGRPWRMVQDSRVYESPESAEREGLLQWQRLPPSLFSGMTTNERLFDAGLMPQWDEALHARDRSRMVDLLSKVELDDQAACIADSALRHG